MEEEQPLFRKNARLPRVSYEFLSVKRILESLPRPMQSVAVALARSFGQNEPDTFIRLVEKKLASLPISQYKKVLSVVGDLTDMDAAALSYWHHSLLYLDPQAESLVDFSDDDIPGNDMDSTCSSTQPKIREETKKYLEYIFGSEELKNLQEIANIIDSDLRQTEKGNKPQIKLSKEDSAVDIPCDNMKTESLMPPRLITPPLEDQSMNISSPINRSSKGVLAKPHVIIDMPDIVLKESTTPEACSPVDVPVSPSASNSGSKKKKKKKKKKNKNNTSEASLPVTKIEPEDMKSKSIDIEMKTLKTEQPERKIQPEDTATRWTTSTGRKIPFIQLSEPPNKNNIFWSSNSLLFQSLDSSKSFKLLSSLSSKTSAQTTTQNQSNSSGFFTSKSSSKSQNQVNKFDFLDDMIIAQPARKVVSKKQKRKQKKNSCNVGNNNPKVEHDTVEMEVDVNVDQSQVDLEAQVVARESINVLQDSKEEEDQKVLITEISALIVPPEPISETLSTQPENAAKELSKERESSSATLNDGSGNSSDHFAEKSLDSIVDEEIEHIVKPEVLRAVETATEKPLEKTDTIEKPVAVEVRVEEPILYSKRAKRKNGYSKNKRRLSNDQPKASRNRSNDFKEISMANCSNISTDILPAPQLDSMKLDVSIVETAGFVEAPASPNETLTHPTTPEENNSNTPQKSLGEAQHQINITDTVDESSSIHAPSQTDPNQSFSQYTPDQVHAMPNMPYPVYTSPTEIPQIPVSYPIYYPYMAPYPPIYPPHLNSQMVPYVMPYQMPHPNYHYQHPHAPMYTYPMPEVPYGYDYPVQEIDEPLQEEEYVPSIPPSEFFCSKEPQYPPYNTDHPFNVAACYEFQQNRFMSAMYKASYQADNGSGDGEKWVVLQLND